MRRMEGKRQERDRGENGRQERQEPERREPERQEKQEQERQEPERQKPERQKQQGKESFMLKLARLIVKNRIGVVVLFLAAILYSLTCISKVEIIQELTDYLPETTETRIGLDLMDEEFTTFGSAKIMVANITYDQALRLGQEMEEVDGISRVSFYDWDEADDEYKDDEITDYYRDACALFTLSFDEDEETELSQRAIASVRQMLEGYDSYVYTTVDKNDSAELQKDMKSILAIVAVIILAVLLFTSGTYMEIVLFLATFGAAAVLNAGTNYWFGTVSFVTNAVGTGFSWL